MATPNTGATRRLDSHRFPEIYNEIEHHTPERQIVYVERDRPWSWQSIAILIGAGALLVSMARSGAVSNAVAPAMPPPQPQIVYHIEDRSWNMCGVCWSNDAPEVQP